MVIFATPTLSMMFYRILAKINKAVLPSFTKKGLDPAKASKLQLAIIGWRYYVTTRALD
ncbi:SsrA-binding protein [Muricauda sp. 2012CJ35-5]|uniref:SsrA-binding protein n=1 Tax=Flagellimonas spongiicola TaxID=2942208 RepID=A0ABT0PMP6_9FLAO|nr:SsrA-binding protein [Allomuricauda spongiicola]MCL6272643.1 SsrA-binding protein [Allomuricauda spongiicola]